MSLINYEISLQLKWSKNCILAAGTAANQNPEFKITDTKLYVPIATLSTQNNIRLLKKLKYGLKEQLIGIKRYLKQQIKHRTDI